MNRMILVFALLVAITAPAPARDLAKHQPAREVVTGHIDGRLGSEGLRRE